MDGDKEELEKEIEEKNKKLLKQITLNEKAMGYNINREEKYNEREDGLINTENSNIEGD